MFGRRKRKSSPELDDYTVEPMEPRVLLSADALGVDAGVLDHDAPGQADWDLKDADDWSRSLAGHDTSDTAALGPAGGEADDRVEIVFLDAGVENGQQLLADLMSRDGVSITQVHLIDSNSDGIDQIAQVLAGQQGIDAIHIFSHGAAGQIQLGGGTLSTDSLDGYSGQLNDWGSALADAGDILIYGCDLAADAQGEALVNAIGILTGADVAASVDQTGHTAQGGDWDLEYRAGSVETVAFTMVELPIWQGTLAAFIVDTNADTTDANPGDGVAEDASGNTSLRAAIMEANALGGADTIFLDTDTYTITRIGLGDDAGDFDIRDDLSIVGVSPNASVIDGNNTVSVFDVHDDASITVSFSNLKIENGYTADLSGADGAGLFIAGGGANTPGVYVSNVWFTGNNTSGTSDKGGAIANAANLTISNSLIEGNTAEEGGGVWNAPTGVLVMENVTISGNSATGGDGGGLFNEGDATLRHVTITNNTASGLGGGVIHDDGAVKTDIGNSIIAGNTAGGSPDITSKTGTITSSGSNIVQDATGASGFGAPETGIDPLLGGLANNGGDLMTHAPGAPAIDAADPALAPNTDQRGFLRGDGSPDIGAHEAGSSAATTAHYLDQFNATAYDGNDGTLSWANDWQEIGEVDGASFGVVEVYSELGEQGLYLWAANNVGAWRQADLSGATAAILSFNWAMIQTESGDQASLQISTDGITWDTLDTFDGPLNHSALQSASYDISAYIDSDTQIRFETISGFSANDKFFVDNVRIDLSTALPVADTSSFWLSTNESASDNNAAVINAEDIVSFGDPDLGLELGDGSTGSTDGTFTTEYTLDENVRALHYVNTAIPVDTFVGGATGTYNLQPGQIVVSLRAAVAVPTVGAGTITVNNTDVLVYTPSTGEYEFLLEDAIFKSDGTTPANIHAVSIVEQDTAIGVDTTLAAGTYLIARSDPAVHADISTYDNTNGRQDLLLGVDFLSDAGRQIQGLELLEAELVVGGVTLTEGTLLITVQSSGAQTVGTSGGSTVAVEEIDVVALNINATEQDSVTPDTDVDAAILFDGSDVSLSIALGKELNGLTLVGNSLNNVNDEPTLTTTASNPTFIDGGAAVGLFSGASVDTVEIGQEISSLTFTVSNVSDGADEVVNVDGTGITLDDGNSGSTSTNGLTYSVSFAAGTATVTLTAGTLSTAEAETLVDGMSYQNDKGSPTLGNRVVTITELVDSGGVANGGDDTSNPGVASTVEVEALDATITQTGAAIDYEDGLIEAAWGAATTYDINLLTAGTVSDASDLSATWRALWDTTNLYLLFEVNDEAIVDDSGVVWHDDAIELFIDPDLSRGSSYDGVNDYQLLVEVALPPTLSVGINSATDTTGIHGQVNHSAGSYFVEMEVPWTTLGVVPTAGALIGIDAHVSDDDDGGDRDGKLAWHDPANQAGVDPSMFGIAQLLGSGNAPVFTNTGLFAIDENSAATTVVGDVDANDGDGGAADVGVTYGITGNLDPDGDGRKAFAIDPLTGVITVNDADDLNYEDNTSMDITVEADDGVNTTTTTVTINLNNVNEAPTVSVPGSVFINEIHYDNVGADTGEFIEIAGVAGNDLNGWSLVLYNGFNGTVYDTVNLSGTLPNQADNFGTLAFNFPADGIQNATVGNSDGLALVDPTGTVVQFLSYEGTFTAVGGPANGMLSTDIGVSEDNGTTAVGESLQLTGAGATLTWAAAASETFGSVNTGQDFAALAAATNQTIAEEGSITFSSGGGNAIVIDDVDAGFSAAPDPVSVTLSVSNGTLTLGSTIGLASLSGNGTNSVTFQGTVAELNAAMDGLVYQPTLHYNGGDKLTVLVDDLGNDGSGGAQTATAAVYITVNPVNDAPTASGTYTLTGTDENTTSVSVQVSAILADASITAGDQEGDTLGIAVLNSSANGTWEYSTNGVSGWTDFGALGVDAALLLSETTWVRYVPDGATPETADFNFRVWDQSAGTASVNGTQNHGDTTPPGGSTPYSVGTAAVSLNVTAVNDPPVADNESFTVIEGGTATEADLDAGTSLLDGDTDADLPGDTLTVNTTPIADVSHGTLTLNANGTFTYVHDGTENFTDSFTYEVSDGVGGTDTATVTITITPQSDNDPVADNESFTVVEGGTATEADLDAGTSLLDGDTDADLPGDTLTVNTTPIADVSHGTLTLNANGTFSYVHDGTENFTDSFTYEVSDGAGGTDTAAVTITIMSANDNAPTLVNPIPDQSATEDVAFSFQFAAGTFNDVDAGDTLNYTAQQAGGTSLPGWLSFDPATRTFSGTPLNGDVGALNIEVTATDGAGATVVDSFRLTISNVNDAPVLGNNQMTLNQGDSIVVTPAMLSATDVDHAAAGLQFTVSGVAGGQFELTSASGVGIFSFTQAEVVAGDVVFVDDGDNVAPSYSVTVGDTIDSDGPRAATIVFNPPTVVTTVTPAPEPVPVIDPAPEPAPDPKPIVPDPPKPDPDPDPDPEPEPEPETDEEPAEEVGDDVVVDGDPDAPSTVVASGGGAVAVVDIDSDGGSANGVQGLLKNLLVRPAALTAMALQQSLPGGFEIDALAKEVRDVLASSEFNSSLDRMRDDVSDATIFHQSVVGSGVAVTTGLSVGYVAWLVRGGVLLSTALSSLPAWQFIDPLPVLARTRDDEDDNDDSLQSIIKEQSERAAQQAKEQAEADANSGGGS